MIYSRLRVLPDGCYTPRRDLRRKPRAIKNLNAQLRLFAPAAADCGSSMEGHWPSSAAHPSCFGGHSGDSRLLKKSAGNVFGETHTDRHGMSRFPSDRNATSVPDTRTAASFNPFGSLVWQRPQAPLAGMTAEAGE